MTPAGIHRIARSPTPLSLVGIFCLGVMTGIAAARHCQSQQPIAAAYLRAGPAVIREDPCDPVLPYYPRADAPDAAGSGS